MKPVQILMSLFLIILFGFNLTSAYAVELSIPSNSEGEALTDSPIVSVEDIDMGDYQSEMYVGKTQLLSVTVLPTNATDQSITYQSSNKDVAMINMMGRITAIAEGETEIGVSVGDVTRKFTLKVTTEPIVTEPSQPHIAVRDIEISNFKDTIKINETVDLTAVVIPKDATKPDITYTAGNPNVATINSSGQIKGVSAGTTAIIAEADGFSKFITITVKIATQNIQINETYLILNVSDTFQLNSEIVPKNADQNIAYKSISSDVVSVSGSGLIKALMPGSGSIIVSAWDTSKIVNVIVNSKDAENSQNQNNNSQEIIASVDLNQTEIAKKIADLPDNGKLDINGSVCEVLSTSVLKELYGTGKILVIKYPKYTITILGTDIKNISNELNTEILLSKVNHGLEIIINNGNNLPGKIHIQLLNQKHYSNMYLYNEIKYEYEKVNTLKSDNKFSVDFSGKYILTYNPISNVSVGWIVVIIVGVIGIGLGIAYIAVKKKHWFW